MLVTEAFRKSRRKDGGDLTRQLGAGVARKLASRSVLKDGPRGFADGLDVGREGKRGGKDGAQGSGLGDQKDGASGKGMGRL